MQAIPDTPVFRDFLEGCQVVKETSDEPYIYFSNPSHDAGSPVPVTPDLYIQYPQSELQLDSFLNVICRMLDSLGCSANRDIAISVLGILAESKESGRNVIEWANDCVSKTVDAQLNQVFVLPSHCPSKNDVRFGPIRLGPFDPSRILYWGQRGVAGYPVDLNNWRGRFCIERDRFPMKIVDWEANPDSLKKISRKWGEHLTHTSILDSYYQSNYRLYAESIPDVLNEQIRVLAGGGLIEIDIEGMLAASLGQSVGLFSWKVRGRHRAWALMGSPRINLNLMPPEGPGTCNDWITSEFQYSDDEQHALKPSIDSYCDFLQRAHKRYGEGRIDDAFLHYVIALDLLLGEEGKSSNSVASRVATLVHRQLENSLADQMASMKQLYRARSKYVHEGTTVDPESVMLVRKVSKEVLWTLLASAGNDPECDLEHWLRRIDFVSASSTAGRDPEQSELTNIGVPAVSHGRTPPSEIETLPRTTLFTPVEFWQERSS